MHSCTHAHTFSSSIPKLFSSSRSFFMVIGSVVATPSPFAPTPASNAGDNLPAFTGDSTNGSSLPPFCRRRVGNDREPKLRFSAVDDIRAPPPGVKLSFGAAVIIGLVGLLHVLAAAAIKSWLVRGEDDDGSPCAGELLLDWPSRAAIARKYVRLLRSLASCWLMWEVRYLTRESTNQMWMCRGGWEGREGLEKEQHTTVRYHRVTS